jgi:hypothetical protein
VQTTALHSPSGVVPDLTSDGYGSATGSVSIYALSARTTDPSKGDDKERDDHGFDLLRDGWFGEQHDIEPEQSGNALCNTIIDDRSCVCSHHECPDFLTNVHNNGNRNGRRLVDRR